MVLLKRAPCEPTCQSTKVDRTKAIVTPRMVTMCEPRRPTCRPNSPAMTAPASGASGIARRTASEICGAAMRVRSALEGVELVDRDRRAGAEQDDEDRQADRRLGGGDGEDEEHEHLSRHVAEVVREGDEVEVDGEQ